MRSHFSTVTIRVTAMATERNRYLSGIEVTYRSSRRWPRYQLRNAEYLSSISMAVNAPGAASTPSSPPMPRSSSESRANFCRKWRTSRPKALSAASRARLCSHCGNDFLRDALHIHLLRHLHEAFLEHLAS